MSPNLNDERGHPPKWLTHLPKYINDHHVLKCWHGVGFEMVMTTFFHNIVSIKDIINLVFVQGLHFH